MCTPKVLAVIISYVVIPPPAATKPSNAKIKRLAMVIKPSNRVPGGTYDAKGRLSEDKVIEERQQGSEQGDPEQSEQDAKQERKEQKVAEQEQQDAEQIKN